MYKYFFDKRGQAMVEFAFILPIFLALLFGMLQFGLILHSYLVVNEAAREGARIAAVGKDNATITSTIQSAAGTLDTTKLTIAISPDDKRIAGAAVTVTVGAPTPLTLPYVSQFAPDTLQGQVIMRVEQDSP